VFVGDDEQPDEIRRVLGESVFVDGRDATIVDAEVRRAPELGAAPPA